MLGLIAAVQLPPRPPRLRPRRALCLSGPRRLPPRWQGYRRYDLDFLFAETLKYAYLLLAPPKTLDLNEVVFNTEAHPLRRAVR